MFDLLGATEKEDQITLRVHVTQSGKVSICFPSETTHADKMVALMQLIDAARDERDRQAKALCDLLKV